MEKISAVVGRVPFSKRTEMHKERVVDGCIFLHGKHKIQEALYRSVYEQIELILDAMEPGQSYTSRDLCGDEYWRDLKTTPRRRWAGMCLAYMVREEILPLKFVGKKSNSWCYARKY